MMGRLLSPEQSEPGRKAEDPRTFHQLLQSFNSPGVPQQAAAFPPIDPVFLRHVNTHNQKSIPSFAGMPSLQERSHSSFQKSLSGQSDLKEMRNSAVSPILKLPPISSTKAAPDAMPPQACDAEDDGVKCPSLVDMRLAYENMMVSYFMPQSNQSEASSLPENIQIEHIPGQQIPDENLSNFSDIYANLPLSSVQQLMQPCNNNYMIFQGVLPENSFQQKSISLEKSLENQKNSSQSPLQVGLSSTMTQHTTRDITSSGCILMNNMNFTDCQQVVTAAEQSKVLKHQRAFDTGSMANISSVTDQSVDNDLKRSGMVGGDQITNISDMSTVLDELSMYMPPQNSTMVNTVFECPNNNRTFHSTTSTAPCTTTVSHTASYPNQPRSDASWGRFSVLPPVITSTTPSGSCPIESDNVSLMSYNSAPPNAHGNIQMGMCYTSFSPFSANFSDNASSAFASSPRYSGRSSYSGRGSRNKRALSNSPLSAEGIDLNTIIRMSPTSLITYINGSRSSSSCVSPGSIGERVGCYGHLSARNSSSSPNSGSNSSGNRRSTSYTPQTSTPSVSNTRSNIASDNTNVSAPYNDTSKSDYLNMDENLLVIQAMQELESGTAAASGSTSFTLGGNIMLPHQVIPECENLQVFPQDIAAFRTEDLLPFVPSILPPVHIHNQYQQSTSQLQRKKPPPSYDQHMARKATLHKNSSSESSSQPSNSSSFESSEGDKTMAGSSSTDTETNRMYACRWLDCTAVFQDQDEFVTHIEKTHVDQKKGEEFICFWKLCPRRLHPFNARYKLLVHMRVHSGDKPNKCTYSGCTKAFSRLENLKIHLRSHTGERPYTCTFPGCAKTFSNSSDRTKHQKTHHETKPYVCQVTGCDKRYTDPSSLRKHAKKSHPNQKEPERKKIRGGLEEMDPKDLSECLMIQAIKPITLCDGSPPEPTDSGLGRSPRGSQPASSSDNYPGLIHTGDMHSRCEVGHDSTSPSSHHSSPTDREKLPMNNNSLLVPILPPIAHSPTSQDFQGFLSPGFRNRQANKSTTRHRGSVLENVPPRNSSTFQSIRNVQNVPGGQVSDAYTPSFSSHTYNTLSKPLSKHQNRESS